MATPTIGAMLKAVLGSLFRPRAPSRLPPPTPAAPPTRTRAVDDYRLLPLDAGLPALEIEALLAPHAKLLWEIEETLSLDHAEFERRVMPVVRRYAEYVHLLPASEASHHSEAGGLVRHSLEVAFHASRDAQGRVWALGVSPQHRQRVVDKWRVAVVYAGLLHDVSKPLLDVGAYDPKTDERWDPGELPLSAWLARGAIERYRIWWSPDRQHAQLMQHGLYLAPSIIGPELSRELVDAECGDVVRRAMLESLGGTAPPANPIAPHVIAGDHYSASTDHKRRQIASAELALGERHSIGMRYVAAMRELVSSGTWRVNGQGSPLHYTSVGLLLQYPSGLLAARDHLVRQGDTSIPPDPALGAEYLVSQGMAMPCPTGGGTARATWRVRVSLLAARMTEAEFTVLRFLNPASILPTQPGTVTHAELLDAQSTSPAPIELPTPPTIAPTIATASSTAAMADVVPDDLARAALDEARTALAHAPLSGPILRQIAEEIASGERPASEVHDDGHQVYLVYPDALRNCGMLAPSAVAKFRSENLIDTRTLDGDRPCVRMTIRGIELQVVPLKPELATVMRALMRAKPTPAQSAGATASRGPPAPSAEEPSLATLGLARAPGKRGALLPERYPATRLADDLYSFLEQHAIEGDVKRLTSEALKRLARRYVETAFAPRSKKELWATLKTLPQAPLISSSAADGEQQLTVNPRFAPSSDHECPVLFR